MDENFLLTTECAQKLFHETAQKMPIFDYHNHLGAQEIYEDNCFSNLTEAWLLHDHYKWRAMRANGCPEEEITGTAADYKKYLNFVDTIQNAPGNPLYHWTHLELQRYFNVYEPLTIDNAEDVWKRCNALLKTREYSVRNLLLMQNVQALCTTDDPADSLIYHTKLSEEGFSIKVLPSFRPDRALNIQKSDFTAYIQLLSIAAGKDIQSVSDLVNVLSERLKFFIKNGCVVSDHSIEGNFWCENPNMDTASKIFEKRMKGQNVSSEENAEYQAFLFMELGKMYAKENIVMQLHIGAIRDNVSRLFESIGANVGCDSIRELDFSKQLAQFLDSLDHCEMLPKTILYNLNPKDNEMLATLAGNFESSGEKAKVQWGPAWWFNDHIGGIENQLIVYARQGVLGQHLGMLTDSRSFLSFPRHEYFRRILCNLIGNWVENGEYPYDEKKLCDIVRNISYDNAAEYFGL